MSKKSRKAKKVTPKTGIRYGYESAATTRLNSDWVASGATADSLIRSSGDQLRNRARDLDRNNDYVISAVNKFTTKVLGEKCPVFQSRIKKQRSSTGSAELNTPLNLRIEEEFRKWQDDPASCSSNKSWNFNRILDLCVRTLMVDGEVFIRRIQMARGRSPVNFCLELIEADNLADTYHGDRSGNPIVNGIEYDEWGAPVAYWFYPYNPNDFLYGKNQNYSKGFAEPIRYPADEILHLYSPRRVTQGRGVSFFAATISRLRDLVGYEQAVLVGARMRAAVMGFITSVEGEDAWGHENPNNPNAPRQYSFEPGTIQKLSEGENFELSSPQDPGPNLEGFARHQLRAFAANLGIAFSSLSGDYSQANYSSERANQIDERRGIRRVQELITSSLLTPVTDWWLDAAVLSGAIAVPEKMAVRDYYCCYTWRLGGFEWVDPYKDAQAFELQLKNGMTTLQRVLAEKNIDLNTLIEERKYEQALLEESGISLAYLDELGGGEEAPEEDPTAEIKEGLTQIRSILNTQSTQIQQLGTVLLEASRSIAMANTAIAEVRGAADRSITVINQSPKLIEPSESVDDMTPIRYTVGRKAKNCKKGKPCGGSCISNAKSCRIGLSADQKALAGKAKKAIKSGGGGDASDPGEEDRNELAEAFLYRYKAAQIKKFKKLANDPPYWEDVMILNGYTSDDYRPINKHLREGSKIDPDLKIAIKRADVALKAMPKFEGTVYRGADLSQDLIDRYKVGETIAERAYVSTSRSKKQAFEGNVRFVIQSKNGVDVSDLSEFKKEQEVLIPRDSKFKVLDKQIKGDETIIFMEEAA